MKYRIDNTVINSDHIVRVDYIPSHSGFDEKTGKKFSQKSSIDITISAIERDVEFGFEGSIDGVASKSTVIVLYGKYADRFWAVYSADALDVMAGEAA